MLHDSPLVFNHWCSICLPKQVQSACLHCEACIVLKGEPSEGLSSTTTKCWRIWASEYLVIICELWTLDNLSVLPAGCEFLGLSSSDPVKVVLDDDGTIVEDEAYFLCLPSNTKFMLLHDEETWAPARRSKWALFFFSSLHLFLLF